MKLNRVLVWTAVSALVAGGSSSVLANAAAGAVARGGTAIGSKVIQQEVSKSATGIVTKLRTQAATAGISSVGALNSLLTSNTQLVQMQESIKRHGTWMAPILRQLENATDSVVKGHKVEGLSQAEQMEGIATLLVALSHLDDMNAISSLNGPQVVMDNKLSYFKNSHDEKVVAGVLGLIQGGNLVEGLLGRELSVEATKRGLKVISIFNDNNTRGDIEAALLAFEDMAGKDKATSQAQNIAVACGVRR